MEGILTANCFQGEISKNWRQKDKVSSDEKVPTYVCNILIMQTLKLLVGLPGVATRTIACWPTRTENSSITDLTKKSHCKSVFFLLVGMVYTAIQSR